MKSDISVMLIPLAGKLFYLCWDICEMEGAPRMNISWALK